MTNRRVLLDHMCISVIIFQLQIMIVQHIRPYIVEEHVVHYRKSEKESLKADNLGVILTLSLHEIAWPVDIFLPSL